MTNYDTIRRECGSPAIEIDQPRFWELLEVMWPRGWYRDDPALEFFAVDEPVCGSEAGTIYRYAVRIRTAKADRFFEFHAPDNATPAEILSRVPV